MWSQNSAISCNQPYTRAATALSVIVKVTGALNIFVSRSFQSAAGDIANISQFAVHHCIWEVTQALYSRRRGYPITREKQDEPAFGFARIAGFLMMQGAIDFVGLRTPHNSPKIFRNRKGYDSLNVQLVCNHRQRILNINACYPGSTHNAFILCQSNVPTLFQPLHQARLWLLGDKSYPLSTWLQNPNTPAQHSYNESHAATRNTISLLKQRFHWLDSSGGALQYSSEQVSHFLVVCCMLHNLAIMRAQPLTAWIAGPPREEDEAEEDEDDEEEQERGRRQRDNRPSGWAVCEQLIRLQFE
uniref:putative nuclease HARBI1 n=1 Tax=Pristiophorus japonicus TaxID=55135 RepID=UPI00398E78A1